MKFYRVKHVPTGLYYQPNRHRGSNLSLKGKVYQNATHGLSSAIRYANRYPDSKNSQLFCVFVEKGSRVHKLTEDNLVWVECKYSPNRLKAETNLSDWKIEEINV